MTHAKGMSQNMQFTLLLIMITMTMIMTMMMVVVQGMRVAAADRPANHRRLHTTLLVRRRPYTQGTARHVTRRTSHTLTTSNGRSQPIIRRHRGQRRPMAVPRFCAKTFKVKGQGNIRKS